MHFLACENDKICSKSAIVGLFRAAMEVRRTFNLMTLGYQCTQIAQIVCLTTGRNSHILGTRRWIEM